MGQKIKGYSLTGKWNWVNTSVQDKDRWQILESFAPSDRIWDFRDNGVMESTHYENLYYRVSYKLSEQKMALSLNGHKLDRNGRKFCLVHELYNVSFLNSDEFYLIDTEDYMGMPDSYLRLHFKRASV